MHFIMEVCPLFLSNKLILFKMYNVNLIMLRLVKASSKSIIEYLKKNPDDQNNKFFAELCNYGRMKCAQWLYDNTTIDLTYNNSQCIRDAAKENHINIVEWLYPKNNWIIDTDEVEDDEYDYEDLLCYCCRKGYFSTLRLIDRIDSEANFTQKYNEPLGLCCQGGHLKIAKWILNKNPNTDVLEHGYNLFLACNFGHLKVAKWLWQFAHRLSPERGFGELLNRHITDSFEAACYHNHINVAKWLLKLRPHINTRGQNDNVFRLVCSFDHLEVAQWLYTINPRINISSGDIYGSEFPFRIACSHGNLNMAKWLYSIKSTINISVMGDYAFKNACSYGHLDVAVWLYSIKPSINVSCIDQLGREAPFRNACKNGHIQTAQWLYSISKDINISVCGENAFRMACMNGHLKIAQWLLEIKPDIDICIYNDTVFRNTARYGHLPVLKWLLKMRPNIDVCAHDDEDAFRWACMKGYLDVAKWLLEIKPEIDISAFDECAFRWSCKCGHLDIAKWLLETKPDIDTAADDSQGKEAAFRGACYENKLDVVTWLLKVRPNLDISAINDFGFNVACRGNFKEIANLLREMRPEHYVYEEEGGLIINWRVIRPLEIIENIEIENDKIRTCPICMDRRSNIFTSCGHQYCSICTQKLYNYHQNVLEQIPCPYCREKNLKLYNIL